MQGLVIAQFNLPIFVAESVIEEHKNEMLEKEKNELAQKLNTSSDEGGPVIEPMVHPKLLAAMTSDENKNDESVRRERRSPGRQADIDSFLSELESDIAKTQHTRFNANPNNQQPSWSYKPSGTTPRSFWKKFGDSIGSTYSQIKTKTKDIVKGIQT
ncbi:Hypothetical protein NTJ_13746 [Nesidiocoris tenuis]|nr:Hypothetical protein NTJ_13746 [Nesidiocoris tenuis]